MCTVPNNGAPKGQRRPHKKPQHGSQNSRSVVSDNDAYTTLIGDAQGSGDAKNRPRRKSQATKKAHTQSDAAAYSDGPTQKSATHHAKPQATPIKQQAYAGPTFHQSPAASALPLPSFYSKSLPNASPLKSGVERIQSPGKPLAELHNSGEPVQYPEPQRESTPLDFLFEAARKANATPGTESPNHRHYLSSAVNTPVSRSPAPRENETDFPFELDSGDRTGLEAISNSSTPFRDRIEAARQKTPTSGGKALDEDERKAKSAQLKQFLMNSAQGSEGNTDNNPFNARPMPPQTWHHQHRSNPNTPYGGSGQGNPQQYFPPMPPMPNMHHHRSPSRHNQLSNLRNVYQPAPESATSPPATGAPFGQGRISTARDQGPAQSNFVDIYSSMSKPRDQSPGHRVTPSAQQLEDDLRKFLKLDVATRV